jgi:putative PIN family toxin of toxin-antitoxin system
VALRPKFQRYFDVDDLYSILSLVAQIGELVDVTSSITTCRDEKDNFLLALVVDGKADYLITGDHDLLAVGTIGDTRIVTISEFLSL